MPKTHHSPNKSESLWVESRHKQFLSFPEGTSPSTTENSIMVFPLKIMKNKKQNIFFFLSFKGANLNQSKVKIKIITYSPTPCIFFNGSPMTKKKKKGTNINSAPTMCQALYSAFILIIQFFGTILLVIIISILEKKS